MRPERILADTRAVLPRDAIITTDVGWNKNGVGQQFPILTPGSILTPGGYATMGFGVPAGLGLQAATGERPGEVEHGRVTQPIEHGVAEGRQEHVLEKIVRQAASSAMPHDHKWPIPQGCGAAKARDVDLRRAWFHGLSVRPGNRPRRCPRSTPLWRPGACAGCIRGRMPGTGLA